MQGRNGQDESPPPPTMLAAGPIAPGGEQPLADGPPSGVPVPKSLLLAVSLTVILLLTIVTAIGVEFERASKRSASDGPVRLGSLGVQERMRVQLAAAFIWFGMRSDQVLHQLDDPNAAAGPQPVSHRLAHSIWLAALGESQASLVAFKDAEAAIQGSEGEAVADRAEPLFRTTASILRSMPDIDDSARQELARWPSPDASDRSAASARLGPFILMGEALVAREPGAMSAFRSLGVRCGLAIVIFGSWLMVALLAGMATLLLLLILLANGQFRSGTGPSVRGSEALLEVFAVFMLAFVGGSLLLELLGGAVESIGDFLESQRSITLGMHMVIMAGASILSACWWRVRGGSWAALRSLAGLHMKQGVIRSLLMGMGGYGLAVILALGGVALSAILAWLAGDKALGSPTHPVHDVMQSGRGGTVMVLILGAIVAPIVEEIFFRGVLYRGLRDRLGSGGGALVVAAVGAILLSSAIFAAIHPQGLIFAPVLAGLGAGFCIVREWSGSVAPAVLAHAFNNGAVLLFVVALAA